MSKKKLYAVLHHEFMSFGVDEMLFFIFSSLKKAEKAIKGSMVDPYSWYEIQEFRMNKPEWGDHVAYYTYRGRKLKTHKQYENAIKKAQEAYKKCKKDKKHHLNA